MKSIEEIRAALEAEKPRSAWKKGVAVYAAELLEELEERIAHGYQDPAKIESRAALDEVLRNGAENWNEWSWGGCGLIYDGDIAERLCNPSELKKTRNGERRPNAREEWLDVQARAIRQAAHRIKAAAF